MKQNQKIGTVYNLNSEKIKAQMQKITNENSTLFHYTLMAETNKLIKLGLDLAGINSETFNEKLKESITRIKENSRHNTEAILGRSKSVQEQQEELEINSVNTDETLPENQFLKNAAIASVFPYSQWSSK